MSLMVIAFTDKTITIILTVIKKTQMEMFYYPVSFECRRVSNYSVGFEITLKRVKFSFRFLNNSGKNILSCWFLYFVGRYQKYTQGVAKALAEKNHPGRFFSYSLNLPDHAAKLKKKGCGKPKRKRGSRSGLWPD